MAARTKTRTSLGRPTARFDASDKNAADRLFDTLRGQRQRCAPVVYSDNVPNLHCIYLNIGSAHDVSVQPCVAHP
eukprot:11154276-Lingulodinium_polyedra.AAC.1